jgi:hypothetical protein
VTVRRPSRALDVQTPPHAACGEERCVERQRAHALPLREGGIAACIPLVGGDEIGLAVHRVGGDRVRLVHAEQRDSPRADVHEGRTGRTVAVADVEAVAGKRMMLEAERHDLLHGGGGDVDDGKGVVLLQRHPGRLLVIVDGDEFRLQVLRHARVRPEDPHAGGTQALGLAVECDEACLGDDRRIDVRDVDDAHRALGVLQVVAAWLALVRHQHVAAGLRERQHVGQCAHLRRC